MSRNTQVDERAPLLLPASRAESTVNNFLQKHGSRRKQGDDDWFGFPRTQVRAASIGLALIISGIIGFHFMFGWTFLTSAYVIVQIVTTVGYGDVVVKGSTAKCFLAFYACVVMLLGGYYLSLFTQRVSESSANKAQSRLRSVAQKLRHGYLSAGEPSISVNATEEEWLPETYRLIMAFCYFSSCVIFGTVFFRLYEHCTCSFGLSLVEGCDETDFGTCQSTGGYVKDWFESFYMSIMTLLTIGFGDHTPKSYLGRFVSLFWMVIGVSCTANFVAAFSEWLFNQKEIKDFSNAAKLIDERCQHINDDTSAEMSRAEFIGFMLVQHNLVPPDIIAQLNGLFDDVERLDGTADNSINILGLRQVLQMHSAKHQAF